MKKYLHTAIFLFCAGCSVAPLYNSDGGGQQKIYVDVIAERDGQLLRRYLKDGLRDLKISKREYRLIVTLGVSCRPFAEMTDESAQRMEVRQTAHAVLRNSAGKVVFERDFTAAASSNISSGHSDVLFSLYGRNNRDLLRELSVRIIEGIRVFTYNEK